MRPDTKARVRKYLDERARMKALDPELIHALHVGDAREAELSASDVRALCDRIDALEAALRAIHAEAERRTLSTIRKRARRALEGES